MTHLIRHLWFSSLVAGAVAAFGPPSHDAKLLQGEWLPVKFVLGGRPLPTRLLAKMKLTMTPTQYDFSEGATHDVGKLSLNPNKSPKEMDVVGVSGPNSGKTIPAIYRFDADQLTVCYAIEGKRPKTFVSPKKSMILLVEYKRKPHAKP